MPGIFKTPDLGGFGHFIVKIYFNIKTVNLVELHIYTYPCSPEKKHTTVLHHISLHIFWQRTKLLEHHKRLFRA